MVIFESFEAIPGAFPIFFLWGNSLYFEKYLEYFRSEKSAKEYFLQIKCLKYSHGRQAAHLDGTVV